MVKAELVNLTSNTHPEAGQSAPGADKMTKYRSWPALSFRFPSGDCSQTDSGRFYLMKVEFCWRREVVTDELEYSPNEKGLAVCVGVESAAQIMIVHRHDGEYRVKSAPNQYSTEVDGLLSPTS